MADEVPAMGSDAPAISADAALNLLDTKGEVRPLDQIETEVIRFAVSHYHGQMSEVARRLRIGRSTLYRKLDDMGSLGPDERTKAVAAE